MGAAGNFVIIDAQFCEYIIDLGVNFQKFIFKKFVAIRHCFA